MKASNIPLLEQPFTLAGKRLKNRIVHVSMTTLRAANAGVTPGQVQYYENRAKGGAAMVVTEPFTWSKVQDGRYEIVVNNYCLRERIDMVRSSEALARQHERHLGPARAVSAPRPFGQG